MAMGVGGGVNPNRFSPAWFFPPAEKTARPIYAPVCSGKIPTLFRRENLPVRDRMAR